MSTVAYNAIFTLIGALFTRRTIIIGLIYIVALELIPALVPAFARSLTVMYYVRCTGVNLSGIAGPRFDEIRATIGNAPTETSLIVVASITVGALLLASWVTTRREFALTDEP
jgi:hypothetical protein